ncbi:MAG: heme lyase CcmF/NrfE family subunit [Nitrospirae bacterium]|nr:heme lyase CcmF/NrfE family subunit [Nitrospirota bacterium]
MIPEIGHFALIVALGLALVQGILPLAGAARGNPSWIQIARPAALGQFTFVLIAFACLTYAFVHDDFSVLYVANHSNSLLPLQYKVAGVWGGHEGSLLLWVFMLTGWTMAVALFSRHLADDMVARVIGVMGLIAVGFHSFMLLTSNPFERLVPGAPEGADLNPLLQDPGLVIHPPMLYMGYVGFSVAFAFAVAALLSGRLDATWARWSRPWTVAAWSVLTMGIALGSWWAYYELGWGGWWFWDPVENASFMPWLVGTALIHSLAVTEKRGSFKNWTVLLAIFAFSLSLLGTFLVRSGVLTSVHAFATDPERGTFILAFLAVVIGSSLTLYAWRAPKVAPGGRFELFSRESLMLTNNVVLVAAAGSVLLGTLYPLLLDALDLGKISVGPPYFNAVFVPLMMPAVFLMAVGPFARWKKASVPDIAQRLKWALAVGVVLALVLPFVMGSWRPLVALGVLGAGWVGSSVVLNVIGRARSGAGGWAGLPPSYLGMQMAHLGVAVFIMGVTMVSAYQQEKDVRMDVGDTVTMGQYTFRLDGVVERPGPNYTASTGNVALLKNGEPFRYLHPEKRIYNVQTMPMTEAAIHSNPLRDLYVSLGEPVGGTAWSVRVYYKPFVTWIWGGCAIMAFGGLLTLTDARYRLVLGRGRVRFGRPEAAAGSAALKQKGDA